MELISQLHLRFFVFLLWRSQSQTHIHSLICWFVTWYLHAQESGCDKILLKALGRAINKAVTIAEILKRKLPLHQINSLTSVEMVDVYEPLEEGLDVVTSRRYVSCMTITLSLSTSGLDTNDPGYQPPLPEDEMHNSPGPTAEFSSQLVPSAWKKKKRQEINDANGRTRTRGKLGASCSSTCPQLLFCRELSNRYAIW
jgi:DNA-binding protein